MYSYIIYMHTFFSLQILAVSFILFAVHSHLYHLALSEDIIISPFPLVLPPIALTVLPLLPPPCLSLPSLGSSSQREWKLPSGMGKLCWNMNIFKISR